MKDFNYKYEYIPSNKIFTDKYQRPLDKARVRKIVTNFDPNIVNPIKVSFRDGKYWVFDGQHTLNALIMLNDNKDTDVYCKIYYGMTFEDEAMMFAAQNGISREVGSRQKLLSLFMAGDKNVCDFCESIESLGIKCDFTRTTRIANSIVCYKALYDIFMQYGGAYLKKLLQLDLDIWGGDAEGLRKEILLGLHIFHMAYKEDYDRETLVRKLKKVSPISILRDGKLLSRGGNKRYAKQILLIYNQSLKANRLEDKF